MILLEYNAKNYDFKGIQIRDTNNLTGIDNMSSCTLHLKGVVGQLEIN